MPTEEQSRDQTGAALFALALFLAAALLFSVQPMIARMVLPVLGGSPAVWTTCMLFFQVELLVGYGYVHFLARRFALFQQVALQVVWLALGWFWTPVEIPGGSSVELAMAGNPSFALLILLVRSVGLPVFVVATTAPLLQCWFADRHQERPREPYFLYAASNAGSLLALLAYPFWIEPVLGLRRQAVFWSRGFLLLALLMTACGWLACRSSRRAEVRHPVAPPEYDRRTWFSWILLALVPSSLLLGVTSYVTTDLAAVPLLWVIPLSLYLLSFILVFSRRSLTPDRFWPRVLPIVMIPVVVTIGAPLVEPFWLVVPLHLTAFFAACMVCHGALAQSRPPATGLTFFYLAAAVGGAGGGLFNALLAPVLFTRNAEYPLAIVAACLVLAFRAGSSSPPMWSKRDLILPTMIGVLAALLCANRGGFAEGALGAVATIAAAGLSVLVVVTHRRRPARFALTLGALLLASSLASGVTGRVLIRKRSFFGVLTVTEVNDGAFHRMFHGSTLHGQQNMEPGRRRDPLTYFTRSGPIGQVFEAFDAREIAEGASIAVTGVGAGSLASYAHAGQSWTMFEIDPDVVSVARDPQYFTYLSDCPAALEVRLGDARLELARCPDASFDLLILDAFSSDAIPAHLLTRESLALYRRKLKPSGWLVFNITNRYLDLPPVVALLASDAGLTCRVRVDADVSTSEKAAGKQGSIWAVMTKDPNELGAIAADPRWRAPRADPGDSVWTDESSDIVRHFRLRPPWSRLFRPVAGKP
jgi:hypothetical protein